MIVKRSKYTESSSPTSEVNEKEYGYDNPGRTVEDYYGYNPELGLTRSEELASDPEYSDFFRNPKIMSAFTEHLDISSRETRRAIMSMNEAEQLSILTSLTSKLYDNIVSKVDDIDYGEIPLSRGDITKLSNIDKLEECISLLRGILKEYKQDDGLVEEISIAMSNVETRKEMFMRAFKLNVELPIMMYNNTVLAIINSVSYMIATCIEFMKTPNQDSFQIVFDKVAYNKTKSNVIYRTLTKFNNSCSSGEFDKAMDHVIKGHVQGVSEGAFTFAAGVSGFGIAAGIIGVLMVIIPILRELVFFFYYARVRVSDFLAIQADLLQMNAYNLQNGINNTADTNEDKERTVSKQLKIVEFLRKASNKLAVIVRSAEAKAEKEVANSTKKMKLEDIDGSSSVSALF